jgi:Zn-dependent protease
MATTKAASGQPKKKSKTARENLRSMLIGGAIGGGFAFLGFWLAESGEAASMPFARTISALGWVDLLLLPLHFFMVILLHELGHLAGGMSRGMRFLMLIVGPLRLRRTVSGLKFDWFLRGDTFGGLAAAMPVKGPSKPRDFMYMVLGGPLTSLIVAAIALGFAYDGEGRVAGHAVILGLMSAAIFLVTIIPMRAGGFMSDGMQAVELARGGSAVEQRNVMMAFFAESMSGVRPRDRDPALLERGLALTGTEPLRDVSLWWMAYHVALDRRELELAGQWIDRAGEHVEAYPSGFRQALACDIAYFSARYRHDLDAATQWYAQAKGGMVEVAGRGLTEAAIAWLRGEKTEAIAALDRAERALLDASDPGAIPMLQDEIHALRADVEALPTTIAQVA